MRHVDDHGLADDHAQGQFVVGEAVFEAVDGHVDVGEALGRHGDVGGQEAHLLHCGTGVEDGQGLLRVAKVLTGELDVLLGGIDGQAEVDDVVGHDVLLASSGGRARKFQERVRNFASRGGFPLRSIFLIVYRKI